MTVVAWGAGENLGHGALKEKGFAGWRYGLLLQNGDYHVFVRKADVLVDLAMDGRPEHRLIAKVPEAPHLQMQSRQPGFQALNYYDTTEELVAALVAAGFHPTPSSS